MDLLSWQPPPARRWPPPDGVPVDVVEMFERLAIEIRERGFERYSSDAVLHRIRWHYQIERGNRDFKCNNNWTAALARWFMAKHGCLGFFETRRSPTRDDDNGG